PDEPTASDDELGTSTLEQSRALSLMARLPGNIKYRKVAILAADGVDADQLETLKRKLAEAGAQGLVIAPSMAPIKAANGDTIESDAMLNGLPSVTMDAVIVPGGVDSVSTLSASGLGRYYVQEAYKHLKVIATVGDGADLLTAAAVPTQDDGVIQGDDIDAVFADFAAALGQHRVWSRNARAN